MRISSAFAAALSFGQSDGERQAAQRIVAAAGLHVFAHPVQPRARRLELAGIGERQHRRADRVDRRRRWRG